jgi:hypothetical protein
MYFKDHVAYADLKPQIQSVSGATTAQVDVVSANLTFEQILTLLRQFGAQFGTQLFAAVVSILEDIQNGTITQLFVLHGTTTTYGQGVPALAAVISEWFGVALPLIPSNKYVNQSLPALKDNNPPVVLPTASVVSTP